MSSDIRLVICDADHTLANTERMLSERTKAMIARLGEQGILFGIASGRPVEDSLRFCERWGLPEQPDVMIGYNGSELWLRDGDRMFTYHILGKDVLEYIVKQMSDLFPFANPQFYIPGTLLVGFEDDKYLGSAQRAGREPRIAEDLSEFYADDNPKIMYRVPVDRMDEVEAYWNEHPSDQFITLRTQPTMFEFCHPDAGKGYALLKWCEMTGTDPEQVMAFGDDMNDLSMIEVCVGVAVENAVPAIKAAARYVTRFDHDADGVAEFVETHVLNG